MTRGCGDETVEAGRDGVPGAYAFFARYVLLRWESCLDVGGGLGVGLRLLRARSSRVRAIDRDPRLLSLGVELGDVRDEPSASVDWVLAIDVIEHVEDDLSFMRELWRVARRGVFVTTPNQAEHPHYTWPYHVREYTIPQFDALCRSGCPDARRFFGLGGGVYGGSLSRAHWTDAWEHQGLLVTRRRLWGRGTVLALRELALRSRRSTPAAGKS